MFYALQYFDEEIISILTSVWSKKTKIMRKLL